MDGLWAGFGWQHANPTLRTSSTSSAGNSPLNLRSAASVILPSSYNFFTQSTNRKSSSSSSSFAISTGLLPHTTSNTTTPKLYTSPAAVGTASFTSSGAKYPIVPTSLVLLGASPWCCSLASPKSASLACISSSKRMLLGFTSRWSTSSSHPWCRYSSPSATSASTLFLSDHGGTGVFLLKIHWLKLPFFMKS